LESLRSSDISHHKSVLCSNEIEGRVAAAPVMERFD